MIDVDSFKLINDHFGHQVGDKVLQEVASLLTKQVRESDLVIRYGGDEFLLMLIETDEYTERVKERIQQVVEEKNKIGKSLPFPITLSIGTAHWDPKKRESIDQVLARADRRMYASKGARRGTG